MGKHKKLTSTERCLLYEWKKQGLSNIGCSRRLGRDKSTIGRELRRNQTKVKVGKFDESIYEPNHAQFVAEQRKQKAFNAKQPLKNKKIYGYVIDHLRQGWSPEQITGRLRLVDHPGDPSWSICHETIYSFIYKPKTDLVEEALKSNAILDQRTKTTKNYITVTDSEKPLWEYLRRKQKRRRKRGGRQAQRVRIPDRVSIHERPKEVEKRQRPGHWEGDSLVGLGRMSSTQFLRQ